MDDGEQLGVMKKNEAIDIAKGRGMDLVEIAPNNKPPVCKIVDYGKFKYQEQKKKNEAKTVASIRASLSIAPPWDRPIAVVPVRPIS